MWSPAICGLTGLQVIFMYLNVENWSISINLQSSSGPHGLPKLRKIENYWKICHLQMVLVKLTNMATWTSSSTHTFVSSAYFQINCLLAESRAHTHTHICMEIKSWKGSFGRPDREEKGASLRLVENLCGCLNMKTDFVSKLLCVCVPVFGARWGNAKNVARIKSLHINTLSMSISE